MIFVKVPRLDTKSNICRFNDIPLHEYSRPLTSKYISSDYGEIAAHNICHVYGDKHPTYYKNKRVMNILEDQIGNKQCICMHEDNINYICSVYFTTFN